MARLLVCLPFATGWTLAAWGGAATHQQRLEAARLNFERLAQQPGSLILHVYARPNKSCQAGRDASGMQPGAAKRGQREAVDPRPWHLVGRVATLGAANVDAAIHAQRPLLEREARLQHQPLRPHRTLVLAWAPGASDTGEGMSIGSFLCSRCNRQSSASASACYKCASPRPDYAPGGELTLARRTSAVASDESGYSPGKTDR